MFSSKEIWDLWFSLPRFQACHPLIDTGNIVEPPIPPSPLADASNHHTRHRPLLVNTLLLHYTGEMLWLERAQAHLQRTPVCCVLLCQTTSMQVCFGKENCSLSGGGSDAFGGREHYWLSIKMLFKGHVGQGLSGKEATEFPPFRIGPDYPLDTLAWG